MSRKIFINEKEYQVKSGLLDEFERGKRYLWADKDSLYRSSCSFDKFNAYNKLDDYYNELADKLVLAKRVRVTGNCFQFNYIVALINEIENKVIVIKETANNRYIQYYVNVDMKIFF